MESVENVPQELQHFLRTIPSVHAVRERLKKTKAEAKFLRRVLRLAIENEKAKEVTDA
jgi:hypothetical protein